MKILSVWSIPALVLAVAVPTLTGCRTHRSDTSSSGILNPERSISVTVHEVTDDNRFELSEQRRNNVDALSTLRVEFDDLVNPDIQPAPPSPEWIRITAMLDEIRKAGDAYAEINARPVDLADEASLALLQRNAKEIAGFASNMIIAMTNAGVSLIEATRIINGNHPFIANKSANGYENVAQWLTQQIKMTHAEATAVLTNQEYQVSVQATRRSIFGGASALHVENWDNIEEGPYSPIDRTGLRLNEGEQQRMLMEYQMATNAVQLVTEIKKNGPAIESSVKTNLALLAATLREIPNQVTTDPGGWFEPRYTNALRTLETLAGDTDAATDLTAAATRLTNNLQTFRASISDIAGSARGVANTIESYLASNPMILVVQRGNLLAQIQDAFNKLASVRVDLAHEIDSDITEVTRHASGAPLAEVLPDPLKNIIQSVAQFESAQNLASLVKASLGNVQAANALQVSSEDLILRMPGDLQPGIIRLSNAGLALGDMVTISVSAKAPATGRSLPTLSYDSKATLMGFHGKPAVHLIFARAVSGDDEATEWNANVAAGVEGHYRRRNPEGFWKAWNVLDPAVGIHMASLNQGDDAMEIGAGGTVSFYDGLFGGGFGYNFSESSEYVFVAINLLSMLNKAKGAFGGSGGL